MTYDDLIVKEADFITGLLSTIKDQVNFKTKPFETIFGVFGTALSWRFGWLIGGLVTAAQLFGYGPGEIGKLIDRYFFGQGAKTVNDMNLSQSNVEGAAKSAAGTITKSIPESLDAVKDKIKSIFAENVQDLKEVKGYITAEDKKTALYMTTCSLGLVKTARLSHLGRFFRLWKRGNRLQLVSGILMKIVWMFAKGLLALGIGGGLASMVGLKTKKVDPTSTKVDTTKTKLEPGSGVAGTRPAGLKHYSNVDKNVKRTLITFLNATIANFETGFMQAQRLANPNKPPVPLERAPGWTKVIGLVQRYNWAPISQVNQFSAFVAPNVKVIAQALLRSVGVGGVKIEKVEPKTPPPKKPTIKKLPTGTKPPVGDEDKLRQLLQGEART